MSRAAAPGLAALDVVSAKEGYVGGKGGLLAWDGTAWQKLAPPAALMGVNRIYAPGAGHLFVSAWDDRRVAHQK